MTIGPRSTPPSEDAKLWEAASSELTPDKSVTRINDSARFLIGNVTLLGTLLTGIGLLSANQNPLLVNRKLVTAVVILATLAVALAFSSTILQTRNVRLFNLNEVEEWYKRHLRYARRVQVAGVLLGVAVILAGLAAVSVLAKSPDAHPVMSMRYSRSEAKQLNLAASVQVRPPNPRDMVTVEITGSGPGRKPIVLLRDVSTPDTTGLVSFKTEIAKLAGYSSFSMMVRLERNNRVFRQSLVV
jgi:hypothetical protein